MQNLVIGHDFDGGIVFAGIAEEALAVRRGIICDGGSNDFL